MELQTTVLCFLVCFCLIGTQSANSEPTFIQINSNLTLSVTRKVDIGDEDAFIWKFNNSKNIVRLIGDKSSSFNNYKVRVEFFPQNLSLILKNVQLSDTGVYTAVLSGGSDKTIDTFDVTVEAPVSAVSLSLDSVSNSSESCNFTVSCKTELFNISRSFTCDTHSCEEPRPQPSGHAHSSSLNLNLSSDSIICNHSNHVSWTQDIRNYRQYCPKDGAQSSSRGNIWIVVIAVIAVIALVGGFICFVVRRRRTRTSERVNVENTVYDLHQPSPVQTQNTNIPSEDPSSMYSMVGPHTGPAPAPVQKQDQNAETLYATVNKPSQIQS